MKNIFVTTLLLLFFRFANATLYVIVVGQNPPDLTNLCLGDTIRFSGDSLNGVVYGAVQGLVGNVDSLLDDPFAIISDSDYVSTWDHILIPGDVGYSFVPQILGMGLFTFNCLTGLSNESENLTPVRLLPNPATNQVIISSHLSMQTIILYDVFGNKIVELKPNSEKVILDISNYATGIYLVEIEINSESIFKKLIKRTINP
jgi:hypothetical protein